MSAPENQVVIIGAGTAGIAAALCLGDLGIQTVVLDRGQVGESWRSRYDGMRLNTGRDDSHLPKRKYRKGTPPFPSRDDVVAHLEEHASQRGIELRSNTTVEHVVRRKPSGWGVVTTDGIVDAAHVVVATGCAHTPHLPTWPGSTSYAGRVLHSATYHNPTPFTGRRVVVVGAGCSGLEIAAELAGGGAAKVWLSVRAPPNLLPPGGVGHFMRLRRLPPRLADILARRARTAAFGDLTEFGLPSPDEGVFSRARRLRVAPALVGPDVADAIRNRSIEVVAPVAEFGDASVVLADGMRLDADVVIAATGYRCGLEPLVGHLDVLTADGVPKTDGDVSPASGLWFLGFSTWPLLIGHASSQSERLAGRIAREIAETRRRKKKGLF